MAVSGLAREASRGLVDGDSGVLDLAAPLVVDACTPAGAPEVDPQAGVGRFDREPPRQPVEHLVVEGAPVEGVRVEEHGAAACSDAAGERAQLRLEGAGGAVEEKRLLGVRVHRIASPDLRVAAW